MTDDRWWITDNGFHTLWAMDNGFHTLWAPQLTHKYVPIHEYIYLCICMYLCIYIYMFIWTYTWHAIHTWPVCHDIHTYMTSLSWHTYIHTWPVCHEMTYIHDQSVMTWHTYMTSLSWHTYIHGQSVYVPECLVVISESHFHCTLAAALSLFSSRCPPSDTTPPRGNVCTPVYVYVCIPCKDHCTSVVGAGALVHPQVCVCPH